jgi:P-type conjugative transfer protein TrbG
MKTNSETEARKLLSVMARTPRPVPTFKRAALAAFSVTALLMAGLPLDMAHAASRAPAKAAPHQRVAQKPRVPVVAAAPKVGTAAIRAANEQSLATSRADGFVNAAQVFGYENGRVYEVWTAPLRITTVSLEPGETIIAKAAGDTERWMIGETSSGTGPNAQTHILIKPFKAGLATNMVVTTTARVYLLALRSNDAPDAFNAAVSWTHKAATPVGRFPVDEKPALEVSSQAATESTAPPKAAATLNQNYAIKTGWTRPPWTPIAVSDDGSKTYVTFGPGLAAMEAPPLFVIGEDGKAQLVNWRKDGSVYVVDRLFERAELRLGDKRPRIVRLERKGARS